MSMPSEQSVLLNKSEYTEHELEKLKRLAAHLYNENVRLENEVRDLRLKQFANFHEDECWIYQGEDSDNFSSLVCPVVMSARQAESFCLIAEFVRELPERLIEAEGNPEDGYMWDVTECGEFITESYQEFCKVTGIGGK